MDDQEIRQFRKLENDLSDAKNRNYQLQAHLTGLWDALITAQVSVWIIVYLTTILLFTVVFDQKAIGIAIGITVLFEFCMHRLHARLHKTQEEVRNGK